MKFIYFLAKWLKSKRCSHRLEWVRTIHGDEINHTGARTVFHCPKCDTFICDENYITEEMAISVSPFSKTPSKDTPWPASTSM